MPSIDQADVKKRLAESRSRQTCPAARRLPATAADVSQLLQSEYGVRRWHSDGAPVPVLVRTILSQNTSDINSGRAFQSLIDRFGSWEAVAEADPREIADAIAVGGLARIKAARIKDVLQRIRRERGAIDLDFLGDLSEDQARAWLRRLPGVGPKTASCVLLFSLGKPALPVDTHVHRVAGRLGLVPAGVSPEQAEQLLEKKVPPAGVYQFHIHLIEHGRKVCRSQRPRCDACVLGGMCPSFMCF